MNEDGYSYQPAGRLRGSADSLDFRDPSQVSRIAPMSSAQIGLWLWDQLDRGNPAYNIVTGVRLQGHLHYRALQEAFGDMVRRHEVLRTRIVRRDGVFSQVVASSAATQLPVIEPQDLSSTELGQRLESALQQRFDLETDPLIRVDLLREDTESHVLLVTLHHIIADGWSVGILFRELGEFYGARVRGGAATLPELEIQYADYATREHDHLERGGLADHLAYWRKQLSGLKPLLSLPTDFPRPPFQSTRGGTVRFRIDGRIVAKLRDLARESSATLFMTLLAALNVLLWRHTGEKDVGVGTAIATRHRSDVEGLIGNFVNILVMRNSVRGKESFSELLSRVRSVALEGFGHMAAPFEKVVQATGVERSLDHHPLCQVVFSFRNLPERPFSFSALPIEWIEPERRSARFDLAISLEEREDGLLGHAEYSTDLFRRETVAGMTDRFVELLASIADEPGAPVQALGWIPATEARQVLETWSTNKSGTQDEPECIHRLFQLQAARTPDAIALKSDFERVTYADLNGRASELAGFLRAIGVGVEVGVALLLRRSVDLVVGMLAVLKAGGYYVPLDAAFPTERLRYVVDRSRAKVVITENAFLGLVKDFAHTRVIALDNPERELTEVEKGTDPEVRPHNLAYVLYTSGSTGRPKGIEVPHEAVPGYFKGSVYARFDESTVFLSHSAVSWDAFTLEVWTPLLVGGTCVLYSGLPTALDDLRSAILRHAVNTLWLSGSHFNLVVDTLADLLGNLEQLLVGGEVLSPSHVARAAQINPQLRIVNGYGPSECTVFSCCHVIKGEPTAAIPIGRPIGDRRVYVLDAEGRPVSVGVPGELCIGGPAVARGYVDSPGLTAQSFVPDPHTSTAGARLFRSGDRVRWRTDGTLEFLGRADDQVKLRGFRIEIGEIEAVLRAQDCVGDAAVVVCTVALDQRLVAYVVPSAKADFALTDLRQAISKLLPEYMVPNSWVVTTELPVTRTGKVDKQALSAFSKPIESTSPGEPTTAVQRVVANAWREVLEIPEVGLDESFFTLGGHSLQAVRIASDLMELFGCRLPLKTVFEARTVRRLAALVVEAEAEPGEAERIALIAERVSAMTDDEVIQELVPTPPPSGPSI